MESGSTSVVVASRIVPRFSSSASSYPRMMLYCAKGFVRFGSRALADACIALLQSELSSDKREAHLPFGDIWQNREVFKRIPSHLDPGRADEVLGREERRRAEEVRDLVVAAPVELTHDRVEAVDLPCIVKCEKDYSVGRMEMEDGPKLTVSALEVHGED